MNDKEILEKYDKALQEYADKLLPAFSKHLQSQSAPFDPLFKKLFYFYIFCSYLADSNLFPGYGKYTCLQTLYAKASLSLFGIYSCSKDGLVTEVAVLLRSLFETYLNVKLLLKEDSEKRLNLFEEFSFVEKWNSLQANKKLLKDGKITKDSFDKTFTPALVKEIEEKYSIVKSNYHPTQPYHWAWKIFKDETKDQRNPTIRFIANKLDLSYDYVKVYASLSISVHNSPNLLNLLSSENVISLAPYFSRLIYNFGCLAIEYMAYVIEDIVSYLGFGEPNEISTYVNAYTTAVNKEYEDYKGSGFTVNNV